jgi:hypothetical protein
MIKQAWIGAILACISAVGAAAPSSPPPPPPLAPLEQLLAPVALYPDALLAQVLTSATSPGQVTEMNTWLDQNKQLQGTQLQEAAQQRGFDASVVALTLFPEVVNQLASQIGWTTELGTAFLSDPKGVMNAVQKLRAQAKAAGNLVATPQQLITTETQAGQQVIVIQPANPQVVYVPVYNPQVVYYPPPPGVVLVGFGLGIAIGVAMSNNAYYAPYGWGAWGMHWHSSTVVVRGGVWVVPPYARYPYVRPIPMPYGGYRPRPYVYAPTTVNINRVTVNNPGYTGGTTPRPKPYASQPTTLPASAAPGARPGATPAQRPTTYPTAAGGANTRPERPASGAAARPTTQPASAAQRPAPASPGKADYGSRGYGAPSNVRPTERAQTSSSAFTGYQSGSAERAASQRGQGSASRGKSRSSAVSR